MGLGLGLGLGLGVRVRVGVMVRIRVRVRVRVRVSVRPRVRARARIRVRVVRVRVSRVGAAHAGDGHFLRRPWQGRHRQLAPVHVGFEALESRLEGGEHRDRRLGGEWWWHHACVSLLPRPALALGGAPPRLILVATEGRLAPPHLVVEGRALRGDARPLAPGVGQRSLLGRGVGTSCWGVRRVLA